MCLLEQVLQRKGLLSYAFNTREMGDLMSNFTLKAGT